MPLPLSVRMYQGPGVLSILSPSRQGLTGLDYRGAIDYRFPHDSPHGHSQRHKQINQETGRHTAHACFTRLGKEQVIRLKRQKFM